jgi:hypothetical protein
MCVCVWLCAFVRVFLQKHTVCKLMSEHNLLEREKKSIKKNLFSKTHLSWSGIQVCALEREDFLE